MIHSVQEKINNRKQVEKYNLLRERKVIKIFKQKVTVDKYF